jgi:hypothetical protein
MEIESFLRQIPPFTKYFMGLLIINTCIVSLGVVSAYSLLMDFNLFFTRFQIWRLFTCFTFYGGFSFNFLMMLFLSHFCISGTERYFNKNIHDFYYLILFVMVSNLSVGYLLDKYQLLINEFLYALMYIICKREPENIVNFWGFKIKMSMFPWVLLGLSVVTGQDIFKVLSGYAVGHLYEFLKFTLKDTYGYKILDTPDWFKRVVNWIASKLFQINNKPQRMANNIRDVNRDPAQEFNNADRFNAFRGAGVRLGGE